MSAHLTAIGARWHDAVKEELVIGQYGVVDVLLLLLLLVLMMLLLLLVMRVSAIH